MYILYLLGTARFKPLLTVSVFMTGMASIMLWLIISVQNIVIDIN